MILVYIDDNGSSGHKYSMSHVVMQWVNRLTPIKLPFIVYDKPTFVGK